MRWSILILGVSLSSTAHGLSIGLFADPNCNSCNLNIPQSGTGVAYVAAVLEPGHYICNVGMAEFRVEGMPVGWTVAATPSASANVVIGDPMTQGVVMAFFSPPSGSCVVLYSLLLTPLGVADMATLRVTQHVTPTNPAQACPRLNSNGCFPDHPVCVEGGTMFVNSPVPCTVGVALSTWSTVKGLYEAP